MKIIVSPANYKIIGHLIKKATVDIIQVGIKNLSDKTTCILTIDRIKRLVQLAHQFNKQIFVYIDIFVFEKDLELLTQTLVVLKKIDVDGVVFNDYAVCQINYEKQLKLNLIYDPKALVTNYQQFNFYRDNGINNVVIANELKLHEINEMCLNKNDIKLIKQVSGYVFMMQSRWDLISLFLKRHKIDYEVKNKKLFLKEELRPFPSLIFENKYGTHIYTGYTLSNLSYLKNLYDNQLDYLYIDGIMQTDTWLINTLEIYSKAIKYIEENKDIDSLIEKEKEINQYLATGFIDNDLKQIMYLSNDMLSEGENNE